MNENIKQFKFLDGGGEMGTLIRSMDWSCHPLGVLENWPQSLKTAVSICLNSRFPMFIWWGHEKNMIYNDAYKIILGEKQEGAMGKPGKVIWPEIWDIVGPMADKVIATGEATWSEDQALTINRYGYNEECYFTFSYSAIHDDAVNNVGIFCAVTETTEKVIALHKLVESEKNFRTLVKQAPVGICILKGSDFFVELANDHYLEIAGKKREDFIKRPLWDVLPEAKNQGFDDILKKVFNTGIAFISDETKIDLIRQGVPETIFIKFVYEPLREPDGTISRIMVVVNEITEEVKARITIEESEKNFRQLANSLPQLVWTTDKNGKQLFVSKRWKEFTGLDPEAEDSWKQIVHPQDLNGITETFANSISTGKPYKAEVRLKNKENIYEWHYVLGEPIKNDNGQIEKWSGVFTNFNEQKLGEESLKLQAKVLESMDEGVSVSDQDGYILFTNSAEDKMFGYEPGGLVGKHVTIQNAYPQEENIKMVNEVINRVSESGSWTGEWFNRKKDGSTFYTHSHISSIDVGNKKLLVCIQRDITTEKIYKEELKRFKFMADNATDPFILMKEDGSFAYLNDLALERWGYSREEAATLRVPDVDPIYNDEEFEKAFKKAQTEKLEQFETIHKRKDGNIYPVEINMGSLFLDGRPYLFAVARDITERKKVREQLNLSLKRFQLMSDTMAQFVWTASPDGKLNYFNQAVFDYSGLDFNTLSTDGWLKMVHPDDREENITKWIHSITTGEVFIFNHRFLKYDGTYRWQLSRAIPQSDSEGNIQQWVGTSTDIHDQKLFEEKLAKEVADRTQELSNTNQQLQKSNAELEQYAYVASHDLQEPLRKIKTFSSMLMESNIVFSDKQNGYISKIMASSERMSILINDILNFSKISETDIFYEPVNLNTILENVMLDLEMELELKKVSVKRDELPVIEAIPIQMNQLFFNLMSNSLKFSKAKTLPEITILSKKVSPARIREIKNLNPLLQYTEIIFSDNGIGFEQQYGERIFNIFQRLHSRTYAGSGIGLALCRKIAHTHLGEILAESILNEGAAFHIFLPLKHHQDKK